MPQIGLAISAAATAFTTSAVGTFLSTTILGQMLTSVALSALSQALASKPRAAGIKTSATAAGASNPVSFVLGQYATGGVASAPTLSHGTEGKTPNAYLTYVIDLGDIAGMALDGLILDGQETTFSGLSDPNYPLFGRPVGGDFADYAWVKYYDGSQTTADAGLIEKYTGYPERPWLTDMIGRGLCYAICNFRYNREIYNNVPTTLFVVSGIPLYDPRKDSSVGGSGAQRWATRSTWTPSNNPMVMIYNILRGIRLGDGTVWGGDAVADDLPLDNWFAAMNVCDATVTVSGGTEPRYRAGIEVAVTDEPASVIEELLKACSGQIVDMGGTWKVRAGGPGLPVYFFFDDDVIVSSPEEFAPFPGLDQTFNGVSASYPDPRALWQTQEAPPRYNATYEAEDGGRRLVAELQLPAVPYPKQVQRLQRALIKDHRRMRIHVVPLAASAAIIEPLDAVSWTSAANGYTAKVFEVSSVTDGGQTLSQQVSLRERNPNDYDFDIADELPSSPAPGKKIRPAPQGVAGWAVTALTISDSGGNARRPAIKILWDGDGQDDVEALEWEVRRAGTSDVVNSGSTHKVGQGQRVITGSILPSTSYEARGRFVMKRRRTWSAWVGVTTPDVRTAKADLADDVTDYMAETATLAGIKPVSTLPAAGDKIDQIVMKVPEGVLYRWDGTSWTRTLFGGIKPGDVDVASFAAGLAPVGLITSGPLPTVKTTDVIAYGGKLYRWSGTAYVASVPAIDVTGQMTDAQIAAVAAAKLTGQVVGAQIADAAISTAKFAAGIEPVGIATGGSLPTTKTTGTLNWNGKLYVWSGTAYVPKINAAGSITADEIAANTITAAEIKAGTISATEIAANAVTTAKIAAGAVTANEIAANAVTAAKITAGAITAGKIAAGTIVAGDIAANAITTAKIATNAVTANEIAANTITAAQMTAGAINSRELASDAIIARHLVVSDFSNMVPDSALRDPDSWTSSKAGWTFANQPDGLVFAGGRAIRFDGDYSTSAGNTFYDRIMSRPVPVEPAGEYTFACGIDPNTGATGTIAMVVLYLDAAGAEVSVSNTYADATSAAMQRVVRGPETPPSGATQVQIGVRRGAVTGGGSLSGRIYAGSFMMRRAANGELVVDGALKARHMAAELIISDVAQLGTAVVSTAAIGDAAITAAKIGDLQVDTLNIKGNAVTTTAYATKAGSVAVAISASGSGGVPSTSSGGALIDITVNRTAGLVTEIVWSGILSPNTTDYSKFSTFRLFVRRNGTQILKTQVTSDSLFDSFRSLTIVDTNTGSGSTLYEVEWASDYQVNNVTCNVKSQTLKATQFKK